jgi:iron uptake system component EfeO
MRGWVVAALIVGSTFVAACGSSKAATSPTRAAGGATAATKAATDPNFTEAVSSYRAYLDDQTSQLIAGTAKLRDAIAAGDLAGARAAYIATRPLYEHIASPAEHFPELALTIDAQPLHGVVEPTSGFHQIEQALWVANSTSGLGPAADKLAADAVTLKSDIASLPMDVIRMTDAYEQFDKHPVTSTFQQEPYSQLDLIDHAAQVEGSRIVFDALRPAIAARSQDSATEIASAFAKVDATLTPLRSGDGYVPYSSLTLVDKRALSDSFGELSSVLSIVATLLKEPA